MFVLDDVEEQGFLDHVEVARRNFTKTMSSVMSVMNTDLGKAGQVCHATSRRFPYLPCF